MKHTKGEWAWQKFGEGYCLTAQHGMREIIIGANLLNSEDEGDRRTHVTMNSPNGILESINPEHPNAKLIAAAPDLLEACKNALTLLSEIETPTGLGVEMIEAEHELEQAIKKATL